MRRFLFISAALLIAFAGCKGERTDKTPRPDTGKEEAGKEAVDFLYQDMEGRPLRLSEKRGRPVVLFFWRMKCPECIETLKTLDALNRRYRDRGLLVIIVGADTMHSAPLANVKEFFSKEGYAFTAIRDSDGFVSEAYGVIRVPKAYVIDGRGVIAAVREGKTDWMSRENTGLIESLLETSEKARLLR